MVIISCLYLALVYLLFFKFKLLPWNREARLLIPLGMVTIKFNSDGAAICLDRGDAITLAAALDE